eukprot:gene1368-428_t
MAASSATESGAQSVPKGTTAGSLVSDLPLAGRRFPLPVLKPSGLPTGPILIANRSECAQDYVAAAHAAEAQFGVELKTGMPPWPPFSRNQSPALYRRAAHPSTLRTQVTIASRADHNCWTNHGHHSSIHHVVDTTAPREAYESTAVLLEAVAAHGCVAVAPGYGFVSENPDFAAACEDKGAASRPSRDLYACSPASSLLYPHLMRGLSGTLGKGATPVETRNLAKHAGVRVALGVDHYTFEPGSEDADQAGIIEDTVQFVTTHGRCMVKAAFGGGGKGIRKISVTDLSQTDYDSAEAYTAVIRERVTSAVTEARSEAKVVCGDKLGHVFVEKFNPGKHIEVQIAIGRDGKAVHFGTRDCSLQLGNQKVVEIAGITDPDIESQLTQQAVALMESTHISTFSSGPETPVEWHPGNHKSSCKQFSYSGSPTPPQTPETPACLQRTMGYVGLATVEFMVGPDGNFILLEVNPRLQVEHPITEELAGVNLKWIQFALPFVSGLSDLGVSQDVICKALASTCSPVVVECRMNMVDPGVISFVAVPPDTDGIVRWIGRDFSAGRKLSSDFDKTFMKLVVTGDDLPQACARVREQLRLFQKGHCGTVTNVDQMLHLLEEPEALRQAATTALGEHPGMLEPADLDKQASLARTRMLNTLDYFTYVLTNQTLGPNDKATHPGARGPMPVTEQPAAPTHFPAASADDTASGAALLQVLYPSTGEGLKVDRSQPQVPKLVQHLLSSKRVIVMDTTRRDGQQSIIATRAGDCELLATMEQEVNVLGKAVGVYEVAGGATFDTALRYMKQDPFERVRLLSASNKTALLQMLIRGRNFLGYSPQSPAIARLAIRKFKEAGIDIFRTFNCQNDVQDLIESTGMVVEAGCVAEAAVCYTGDLSDPEEAQFTLEYYLCLVKTLLASDHPPHILGIKDMAGQLTPTAAHTLISALRKEFPQIPIHLHMHSTGGWAVESYVEATRAGVHLVDCGITPFADSTAQPSIVTFVSALQGHSDPAVRDRCPIVDTKQVEDILVPYWRAVLHMHTPHMAPDVDELGGGRLKFHQAPGGQLSNMAAQIKANVGSPVPATRMAAAYEIADRIVFGGREDGRRLLRGVKVTPSSKAVGDLTNVLLTKSSLFQSGYAPVTNDDNVANFDAEDRPGFSFDTLVGALSFADRKKFDADEFWSNSFVRFVLDFLEPNEFPESVLDLMSGNMGQNEFGYNPALQRVLDARPDAIARRVDYDFATANSEWRSQYGLDLTDEQHVMSAIFPAVFKNYFTGPHLSNVPTPHIYQGPDQKSHGTLVLPLHDTFAKMQVVGTQPDPDNADIPITVWQWDCAKESGSTTVPTGVYVWRTEPVIALPVTTCDITRNEGELVMGLPQAKVIRVRTIGDYVEKGEWVAVVEAMKMQVIISAPERLEVTKNLATPGHAVKKGVLVVYESRPVAGLLHGYVRGMSTADPVPESPYSAAKGNSLIDRFAQYPLSRTGSVAEEISPYSSYTS